MTTDTCTRVLNYALCPGWSGDDRTGQVDELTEMCWYWRHELERGSVGLCKVDYGRPNVRCFVLH